MQKILKSTAFRLIVAIFIGIAIGYGVLACAHGPQEVALQVLIIAKQISSSIILFMVPLIICGCVAPSITGFTGNVTKLLAFTIILAYASSIAAAFFSMAMGFSIVPSLHFGPLDESKVELPKAIITLAFPTMDTMSALLLAILIGLGAVWIKSRRFIDALADFQRLVLTVVKKVLIPLLPIFVGSNFALITFQGQLSKLTVFLPAVLIVIGCQLLWIAVMYIIAAIYSKDNSWNVLRYYGPAYFTAVGTMSSAATLPVALECIRKSPDVRKETSDFAVPLYSNIHLCGSVISETFLVITTYYLLFHQLPNTLSMIVFVILACVIAIGSPGIPGGINVSCSTLVLSLVLVGKETDFNHFLAIMTAIYTIQDGFGTACNVTCDGALTLMTDRFLKRQKS